MNKGAYEIIKLMIQNTDQSLTFTFADGTEKEILIDPDKLIAELNKDQNLEEEANWLADELIGHGHILGTPADSACELIAQWREAARKAVGENNAKSQN